MVVLAILAAVEALIIIAWSAKYAEQCRTEKELRRRISVLRKNLRDQQAAFNRLHNSDDRIVDKLMQRGRQEAQALEDYYRRNS